jgi:hypothetical protein
MLYNNQNALKSRKFETSKPLKASNVFVKNFKTFGSWRVNDSFKVIVVYDILYFFI